MRRTDLRGLTLNSEKPVQSELLWLNLQGKSLRRQKRFSANLLRLFGATRKHVRSLIPLLVRTWWFSSLKEDLKKSSLGVAQCFEHGSIGRFPRPRFQNRNRKQNSANTPQPRVWLIRFLANLSLLCQCSYGGLNRSLQPKLQA